MKINTIKTNEACYTLKSGINVLQVPFENIQLFVYLTNILNKLVYKMRGGVASYRAHVYAVYDLYMELEHDNNKYDVIYKKNGNSFQKDINRLGNVFTSSMSAKALTQYPLIKSYIVSEGVSKSYFPLYKLIEKKLSSDDLVCTLNGGVSLDYEGCLDEGLHVLYSYILEEQVQEGKTNFILNFIDSILYKIFPGKGEMRFSIKENIFTFDLNRYNQGPAFDITTANIQDLVVDIILHAYCRTASKNTTQDTIQAIDGIVLMSGYYMRMDNTLFSKAIHVLSDTFKNVQFIIDNPERK